MKYFLEPKGNEQAFAPKITEKVKSQRAPDGAQVEFVCKVEARACMSAYRINDMEVCFACMLKCEVCIVTCEV